MGSLFDGLNIARNTLLTQSVVLNLTGHNISNANTPGYSRQSVILAAVADTSANGMVNSSTVRVGSGVEAKEIIRSRFALYDFIYRKENQDLNGFIKTEELMKQVELLFDEPSDRGLSNILNDFFNGWQELADEPLNMAARESLKSSAVELTSRIQRIYAQLQTMREDIDTEIAAIPEKINEITSEIADLNVSIRLAECQKYPANDLRDKRDLLVDSLSEYADVRVVEQDDGTLTVMLGSKVLVERDNQNEMNSVTRTVEDGNTRKTVFISEDGVEYVPESGKLGALIRFRDQHLKDIMDKLDTIAESLVVSVNFEHQHGYGLDGEKGRDFFDSMKTKAFNITISDDIQDVSNIAVSSDGSKGDNGNALRINNIKDDKIVEQKFTLEEYYNSLISSVGIQASAAQSGRMNEELLVSQINNAREGIKGVSVDEELIQMIQTQRIYQSASRLIVVLDSLLEEIIQLK